MLLQSALVLLSLSSTFLFVEAIDYQTRIALTNEYINQKPLSEHQLDLFKSSFSHLDGVGFLEILQVYFKNETSQQCQTDIEFTLDSYKNYTKGKRPCQFDDCSCKNKSTEILNEYSWIKTLLDSYGKQGSYVEQGNVWWLGGYSECLEISKVSDKDPIQKFQGRYCAVSHTKYESDRRSCEASDSDIETEPISIPIHYGVCIPRSCFEGIIGDMQSLLHFYNRSRGAQESCTTEIAKHNTLMSKQVRHVSVNTSSYTVNFTLTCHDTLHMSNDIAAIMMITICSFIGLILLVATGVDLIYYQKQIDYVNLQLDKHETETECYNRQSLSMKILLCFSIYTNAKKIWSTERTCGQLDCLHGVRFLSMTWVILGHTYFFAIMFVDNILSFKNRLYAITEQTVLNATFSVDTFFVISGLLVSYLWLKETEKRKAKNLTSTHHWILYYLLRFIRITPPYMLLIGIDVTLIRYFTDGPLWNQNGFEINYCKNTWWTNLLYVNNFVDTQNACYGWAWFLADDMQFHWIAPLFLVSLWLFPYIGVALSLATIIGSSVTMSIITYVNNFPPNQADKFVIRFNHSPKPNDAFDTVYIKPYTRAGPFFIGILVGFLLFKCRDKKVRLSKTVILFLWCFAAFCNLSVLYGLYNEATGHEMNKFVSALYAGVARSVWALGVGWVIFACVTGNGGLVNKFLSWRMFIPFSRLTYCAYLIHPLVIMFAYYSRQTAIHFDSDYTTVYLFLAHIVIAYSLAFVVTLAFESPIVGLMKLLLSKRCTTPITPQVSSSDVKKRSKEDKSSKENNQPNCV